MNISRYTWPVIIAAGLHSALFFASREEPFVPCTRAATPKPEPTRFPPSVEMVSPPAETSGEEDQLSGGVAPLPSQPEVLRPLADPVAMPIPVVERTARLDPVRGLAEIPRDAVGLPGDGSGPRAGVGPVASLMNLDRPPRAIAQPSPDFPYSLRHDGISGSVTVEFVVGTDGHVLSANAVKWTQREFVDPAVRAVLRWKFEPGTIDGRRVRFRMTVPIEFNAAG